MEELNQKLSLARECDKRWTKTKRLKRFRERPRSSSKPRPKFKGPRGPHRPFGEKHGPLDRPGFGGPHGPLDRGPPWPRLGGLHEPHGFHGPGLGGRPTWTPRTRIRYTTWIDG